MPISFSPCILLLKSRWAFGCAEDPHQRWGALGVERRSQARSQWSQWSQWHSRWCHQIQLISVGCVGSIWYMDHIWIIYGSYMDHIWIIYGSYMDHIWIIYGSYELLLQCRRRIFELGVKAVVPWWTWWIPLGKTSATQPTLAPQ